MKTIWKYTLNDTETALQLPTNSKILSVQNQNEEICMWVEVDVNNKETTQRYFKILGTGDFLSEDIGIKHNFINTVQLHGGRLVFHIYERLN